MIPRINPEEEYKKIGVAAYVLQNTQNLVISGFCFAEGGYENT